MASYMAKVYANLIRNGKKKIEEVPEKIRAEVEELLLISSVITIWEQHGRCLGC